MIREEKAVEYGKMTITWSCDMAFSLRYSVDY